MFSKLEDYIDALVDHTPDAERKESLQSLISYLKTKVEKKSAINLNFICTHNSRRSHLSQVWAQTMASYYDMPEVNCFSAGTEATAIYPAIIETLKETGFLVSIISEGDNPVYSIKYAEYRPAVVGFSKDLAHPFNPSSHFCAIMTCNSAYESCPVVSGAEERIPILFEDPKIYDNTPEQKIKYKERSLQIASEMFYVFSQLNN